MYIYQSIFILSLFCFLFSRNNQQKVNKSLCIVFAAISVIVIGLRDYTIGIDAFAYRDFYNAFIFKGLNSLTWDGFSNEVGFLILHVIFKEFSLSWYAFSFFCALVYIYPIFLLIYKKSENVSFSILLFYITGFFFFPMSTVRQSIAMGFCLLSFISFDEKKYIKALLLTLLACTMHNSGLIFVIYMLISFVPLTKRNFKYWLVLGLVIAVILKPFLLKFLLATMSLVGRDYEAMETGGNLQELFFIITFLLPFLFIKDIDNFLAKNEYGMKFLFLAMILLPILQFHPALGRLYFYFSIFIIILIPNIFSNIKIVFIRNIGINLYLLVYLILVSNYFQKSACLFPYKFFFE